MLENCDFPKLPTQYDVALRDAVSFVLASFTPVGIIAEEQSNARPISAHIMATGHVIVATDPIVAELRQKAKWLLTQPPDLNEEAITRAKYTAARVRAFFQTSDCQERVTLATEVADRILGTRGFFEWTSVPEIKEKPEAT